MTCDEARAAIRDGAPAERRVLDHLASCEACRAVQDEHEAILAALRDLPDGEPGPDHALLFRRAVKARLRSAGRVVPGRRWGLAQVAALAAVLALVFGLAAVLVSQGPWSNEALPRPDLATGPATDEEGLGGDDLLAQELDSLLEELAASVEDGPGARAWTTALTGDTGWIESLTDEDQRALLEALDEDLG